MKMIQTLEVEQTLHDIEERANRNRMGMLVTREIAEYRAHGAKKDVDTLLAVVNAVMDKLAMSGDYVAAEGIMDAIHGAIKEKEEANV